MPKKNEFLEFLEFLMWTYVIIGSIIVIYLIFLKLKGNSPSNDDIMLTLLSVILAGLIGGGLSLGINLGKFNQFMKDTERSLSHLHNELHEHLKNRKP